MTTSYTASRSAAMSSSGTSMPFFAAAAEAKRRAPGRRTSGSASIVLTTVSTRSEILLHASQRRRIDGDECLADARAVAFLGEEGVGLGADRRAGERGADQLEHEREHRALGAADRKEAAALDRLLRVGGRLAVGAERPAFRDALAFAHRHHDAAAHHGGHGEVDDQRVLALAREGGSHRIGAEQRLLAAPGGDRGRRIGEREADQAGLARPAAGGFPCTPTCALLRMPAKAMPLRRARWITSSIAHCAAT